MTSATTPPRPIEPIQPFLHDLTALVLAPCQVWCGSDGQVRPTGAQGLYHADVRVLSEATVTVDGAEPEHLTSGQTGVGVWESTSTLRNIDIPGADPTTALVRSRTLRPGALTETLQVRTLASEPVVGRLAVRLASDLARTDDVKQGLGGTPRRPEPTGLGVRWSAGSAVVTVDAPGAEVAVDDGGAILTWDVTASLGSPHTVSWTVTSSVPSVVDAAPGTTPEWSVPTVTAADSRLAPLVARSLTDLAGLRMTSEFAPGETFLAAGAPWFFTLFGRDSIWAARMLLPLGTDLARGTLRTLAARQGEVVDHETDEAPGKILHEIRAQAIHGEGGMTLPPLYYGTVDATSLWVCLLHDAWRWGMDRADVEALLPNLERALGWMRDHGDTDGDGFLDYIDHTGRGLSNQGWKDSGDSVQWRDGSLAQGPIALSEVQAYAYEAAVAGAALLDEFGRDGGDEWRTWAEQLKTRFRERFWLTDGSGPYVAIALDCHGNAVDTVTSNMGHLLGTGILSAAEEAQVAARLVAPDMSSGYGLRTLSTTSGGFWPLRYHGGTVWTHDTAIVILGLAKAGRADEAAILARGLLEVAGHVGYQMPELFGGNALGDGPAPLPYPASCHPQAWSAASSVAIIHAVLDLKPAADGSLEVGPAAGARLGALTVDGVRVGRRTFRVAVAEGGTPVVTETTANGQPG